MKKYAAKDSVAFLITSDEITTSIRRIEGERIEISLAEPNDGNQLAVAITPDIARILAKVLDELAP